MIEKMLTHKELKERALARADVKAEYERLNEEFAFLDEFLKARSVTGLTEAEIAQRIGTTATLRKYGRAVGYRLEVRLVRESGSRKKAGLSR